MSVALHPLGDADFAVAADFSAVRSEVRGWAHWGAISILALTPLAFGATSARASLLLTGAAWMALLCWLVGALRKGQLEMLTLATLGPALLLLAFTAWHWVTRSSANPEATQLEWLRWVGILSVALVAGESVRSRGQLLQLCRALAISGLLVSTFAIAQYWTGNGKIYWLVEPLQGGWMFGPYVNRNHFAGLMELWIPVALGLAMMPENTFMRRWLWCAVALVMGTAVVLSGSRGGVIAITVQILLIAFVAAGFRGRRTLLTLAISLALMGGSAALLGRSETFERYKHSMELPRLQQEEASLNRIEAWRGAWMIFLQHPVTGTGLDTFATHFPAVRSFATDKVWTHAHNDFLQFLSETGLIGAALAVWVLAAGAKEGWKNVQRTMGTSTGAMLIGLGCACAGFMVHGWLDFNFHVPANAANFAALGTIFVRRGWDED